MIDANGNHFKCRNCGSNNIRFYDGALGYEAWICQICGEHHNDENPLVEVKQMDVEDFCEMQSKEC